MTTTYPGRDALNKANARARRAFAAVHREATRHDEALLPELGNLVAQAADALNRIAAAAEQLESSSQRHQRDLKQQEDKIRANLRRAQRRGGQGAARATQILAQLDAGALRHERPADAQ